ncbi:MAG: membrane dipeptidase, partial [Bacteroidales bacterium]|nr:membrane dipeptidase [Bacteroidales bacterium]
AWYEAQDRIKREVDLPGVEEIVDHIDHAVAIAGIEHVGIGTDFDGVSVLPEGINNITDIWKIFDEMRRRGHSSREISLVSGENLINVLDRVISCSESAG